MILKLKIINLMVDLLEGECLMISIIVATDDDLLIGKKDSSNGMPWT